MAAFLSAVGWWGARRKILKTEEARARLKGDAVTAREEASRVESLLAPRKKLLVRARNRNRRLKQEVLAAQAPPPGRDEVIAVLRSRCHRAMRDMEEEERKRLEHMAARVKMAWERAQGRLSAAARQASNEAARWQRLVNVRTREAQTMSDRIRNHEMGMHRATLKHVMSGRGSSAVMNESFAENQRMRRAARSALQAELRARRAALRSARAKLLDCQARFLVAQAQASVNTLVTQSELGKQTEHRDLRVGARRKRLLVRPDFDFIVRYDELQDALGDRRVLAVLLEDAGHTEAAELERREMQEIEAELHALVERYFREREARPAPAPMQGDEAAGDASGLGSGASVAAEGK